MSKVGRLLLPPLLSRPLALALAIVAGGGHTGDDAAQPVDAPFVGEYRGQTRSGLAASLTITPDLRFVYQQERGGTQQRRELRRSGKLKVVGANAARAGAVTLRWKSRNSILVGSPYGSGLTGTSSISNEQETGASFTMRRQGVKGSTKVLATFTLQPTLPEPACRAELSISYTQMHERIRVDLTAVNDDCAASAGDYALRVRTASADGEYRTRTFQESWLRHDAQPVHVRRHYPMDGDATLKSVRVVSSRKSNCRCLDEQPAAAQQAE